MTSFQLSNSQKRTLITELKRPGNADFILAFKSIFPLKDEKFLKKALDIVIDGNLCLQISKDENMDFSQSIIVPDEKYSTIDFSSKTQAKIDDYILNFSRTPFENIFNTPLFKILILKTRNNLILLVKTHHIITDGTTKLIISKNISDCVSALKEGKEFKLANNSYEIFVEKEKEYLKSEDAISDKNYWVNNLKDYSNYFYETDDLSIESYNHYFNKDLINKLKSLSNIDKTHISPFVLALSGISFYFCKSLNLNEMVWNTSYHGRAFGDKLKDMVGMFVNMIPLKISFDDSISFKNHVLKVKEVLKEGLTCGRLSFDQYIGALQKEGVNPQMLSSFSIVSNSNSISDNTEYLLNNLEESEFPFHIRVNASLNDENGLQLLTFAYNKSLFSKEDIVFIANNIESLFESIVDNPDKLCSDFKIDSCNFFKGENYFKQLNNNFNESSVIPPDKKEDVKSSDYLKEDVKSSDYLKEDVKSTVKGELSKEAIESFISQKNISYNSFILSTILFNLTKFVFSKEILISTNGLPFGFDFNKDISVDEFLANISDELAKYDDFEHYPYENLVNRIPDLNILYQFSKDNTLHKSNSELNTPYKSNLNSELNTLYKTNLKLENTEQYDFVLNLEDDSIILNYNSHLYSKDLIKEFLNSLDILINKFIENPEEDLKNISIVVDENINDDFIISDLEEPLLNKLFEKEVLKNPNKTILHCVDKNLTYKELNEEANAIANSLIKKGVKLEDKISFMMKRDSRLIATVLGIVKAGCAFIPIDPNYPRNRVEYYIKDSDAKFIITNGGSGFSNELNVDDLLKEEDKSNPNPNLDADNLCFLIYTSGSTGKPKGVMLTHRGITNYINPDKLNIPIYALKTKVSKFLSISTVSFIVFLREIFGTIMNSIPVVFASEEEIINPLEFVKLFNKTDVDGFGSTPTRLLEFLEISEIQDVLSKCKIIIVGGEGFPPKLFTLLRKYSEADIYNSYGPTEVTIASHGKLVSSEDISAGTPMLNVCDSIMDIDGNPLPYNVVGELWVGGSGLARAYLNDDELNHKLFKEYNGVRYYNTGDLAKRDSSGELYILGRNDSQIKLRGLRIELGEIERAISNYPGVKHVIVQVKTIENKEYLCGYIVESEDVDINKLKDNLFEILPSYMVPSYLIKLDSFPKTPNGKIDFKNLAIPESLSLNEDIIRPKTSKEKKIYSMLCEILKFKEFGVNTDLFKLGLTSLSIIKLVSMISKEFNRNVNLVNIMKSITIRDIVKEIDSCEEGRSHQKQEYYPLGQNQLGIYFDYVKNPEKLSYNLPKLIKFNKNISPSKLKSAIVKAINLNPYLKVILTSKNGEIYQKRRDDLEINNLITIDKLDGDISNIINTFIKPFSLFEGSLFRFKILDTDDGPILLSDFHHIIVDGSSLNLLFDDIAKVYQGDLDSIKEPLNGYDYALEEKSIEKSNKYKEAEYFFKEKFSDFSDATVVSPDLNGLDEEGVLKEKNSFISKVEIDEFCSENNISPNILFLSATSIVLSKFVFNKNILISTISNGRFNPKYAETLGMLVKTLPIALIINSDLSIKEYFNYINDSWFDLLKYDFYPFTKLSDKYNIYPEFFYGFHGKILEDISINGESFKRERLDYDALKFKLSLNIIEEEKYRLNLQYNDVLYSEDLINTFLNSLDIVLNKLINLDKTSLIKDISIVKDDYEGDNDFKPKELKEPLLNKIFENHVKNHKDDLALIAEDGEFTYDELNKKANRIANALIKKGIKVEDKVLFILNRNSNLIATVLGILKSGAAFIPVDPEYPQERIDHVFNDSEAEYIITNSKGNNSLDIEDLLKEENIDNPNPNLSKENLAYLIYTSGSTGLAKGVMISHENLANYILPVQENIYMYDLVKKAHKSMSITTVAFDIFIHEVFSTLLNGLTMVFANEEECKDPIALIELFKKTKADVISSTPSRLLQYLEIKQMREVLSYCTMAFIGGEPFSSQLYNLLDSCLGKNVPGYDDYERGGIFNVYGPTEITIACNNKSLDSPNNITTGPPLYNVYEKVMDIDGNPLPVGVVGDLYVGGKGVSRAYINREKLNNERYVTINGIKYFKCGDFAKREKNGEISILGRLDNQIKLRGLRIEIGEIETNISNYPGIKSVVVVVKKLKGHDHLCAYYTTDIEIDINDLKEKIGEKLVPYMVPTVYTKLDELPRTLNGKIDIKNLPDVELDFEYVAPENEIEAFFARVFGEILGIDKVGVTDNFFELGGTSLLVTKITLAAMNENYDIKYGDVFTNPSPRLLGEFISHKKDEETDDDIIDYDYSSIDEVLKENTLDNFINGEKEEIGDILLTGATGFLGIHVLHEFLENYEAKVYCLIRKGRTYSSENRLKTLLFFYFSNDYADLFNKRIFIIEGDVTKTADFNKALQYNIDTVINCAANVKHFAYGSQIEDINVGGVIKGLEFAKLKDCKFIQISTTSVAGESVNNYPPKESIFNEKTLYIGQALDNKYLSSKFKGEREVLEGISSDGINAKIMRVGNLMARHSDSEFQINFETNGFINRIKAFATIGKMPYNMLSKVTEITPIDIVAQSILKLASAPRECCVFHVYNNHTIYFADILNILNTLNFDVKASEEYEFEKAFKKAKADESKQKRISGLVTQVGMGKSKNRELVKVVNDYSIQSLFRLGIRWPLITDEYLYNFIKYLQELNFFE